MYDIDLNILNPFNTTTVDEISSVRQNFYLYSDLAWKSQEPIKLIYPDFTKFSINYNRYIVSYHGYDFHVLFIPKDSNNLFVNLSCGSRTKESIYPTFQRWTYTNAFGGSYLGIEDPSYGLPKHHKTMWYYGTAEISLCQLIADIVDKICNILTIKYSNLFFVGSSCGGTAAIYLCNLIPNSTYYAMNSQLNLAFDKGGYEYFKNNYNIDFKSNDKYNRNIIYATNKDSIYFLIENAASLIDKKYIEDFSVRHKINVNYGITQNNNIITWLTYIDVGKRHSANPSQIYFPFLNYLKDSYQKNINLNIFNPISCILSETLFTEHLHREKRILAEKNVVKTSL